MDDDIVKIIKDTLEIIKILVYPVLYYVEEKQVIQVPQYWNRLKVK